MAIEIERKFLVADDAWRGSVMAAPDRYRQGYLAVTERAVVRVRLADDGGAWLGVKERIVGPARGEYEYPIPAGDARELLGLSVGSVVEKRRYRIACGGREWEVDEFLGENAGLVVAEIELEHPGAAFERPPWLGREVTDDSAYYNVALALKPWRQRRETAA